MMTMRSQKGLRVLLGGVPFGRDNVGDEAILECMVNIVREVCPGVDAAVSTDDQAATAEKLGVRTYPLFGFDPPGYRAADLDRALEENDAFVWSGATGLSDYPAIPLRMMARAQELKKRTAVFCVGMNAALNPYLYKLMPGKRRAVYEGAKRLTGGLVDLAAGFERKKLDRTRTLMREAVARADLVVLRDAQSAEAHKAFVGDGARLTVAADPAITLRPAPLESAGFDPELLDFIAGERPKLGICVSAQSPVRQSGELVAMLDRLIQRHGVRVVGVPMNPITDARLMSDMRDNLAFPEGMRVAEGRHEPDAVAGLAGAMDVVVSSRLHLLILASIGGAPIVGISRGSKVVNFTSQFGLPDLGSVDDLDVAALEREILARAAEKDAFSARAGEVLAAMRERLDEAKEKLGALLNREA